MEELFSDFAKAVIAGLSVSEKSTPSRFLYDAAGDALFQEIMALPEYYLTRTEFEILTTHATSIVSQIDTNLPLQLVELGAGDGIKTKILLRKLYEMKVDVEYFPIDISKNALNSLKVSVQLEFPDLKINTQQAEYFEALQLLKNNNKTQKLVLFLGSNIGNMSNEEMNSFLELLHKSLNDKDKVLIGLDLVKNSETILAAYNDAAGVTKKFNVNLLRRMNQELGANFNLNLWKHLPMYDEQQQAALSFLESTQQQTVSFEKIALKVDFKLGEKIYTERSQKFTELQIAALAKHAGFTELMHYKNTEFAFVCALWKV